MSFPPDVHFSSRHVHDSRTNSWWVFEILAFLFSFGSFSALFIILVKFNNRPLDDWHSSITLNAIVSISATISQSALLPLLASGLGQLKWLLYHKEQGHRLVDLQLFDSASRGPSGALKLMLRGVAFPLGTIGAFTLATTLAFGPFVQQSVNHPTRNVTVGLAEIPRISYWNGDFDLSYKVAAYDALLGSNLKRTNSAISPICTTGNCAFPDYSSLGICSRCVDVSSYLTFSSADPQIVYDYGSSLGCTKNIAYNTTSSLVGICPSRIEAPNGLSLDYGMAVTDSANPWAPTSNGLSVMNTSSDYLISSELDAITTSYNFLGNFSVIARTVPKPIAFDCVFSACAKRYSSNVTNGRFVEKTPYPFYNDTPIDSSLWPWNNSGVGVIETGNQTRILNFNLTTTIPSISSESGSNEFNIDYVSMGKFQSFLTNQPGLYGNIVSDQENFTDSSFIGGFPSSDYMQGIWENGIHNLPQTMDHLATAWTNNMRSAGIPSQGSATRGQTFIHVDFLWLIFPFVLELLALTFLLGTIISTVKNDVPTWKASALAPLFHAPDTTASNELLDTSASMEEYATSTKAQLTSEDGHWRLKILKHDTTHLSAKEEALKRMGNTAVDVLGAAVG